MNKFFIRKKEIKLAKLILISPWLGQIIDLLYIISLPLIIIKFLNFPIFINNYDTNVFLENFFEKEKLINVTNKENFFNYLINTTEKLYDYSSFPIFIPIGRIRIRKFSINNNCLIDVDPDCLQNFSCIY